ncbi:MAG: tripartite tricarboxylate transporter substrate binding protein [Burkholderiales bacterium]
MKRIAVALMLSLAAAVAPAQTFPERAIKIVVPYPPGASTDILARQMAEGMGQALGQSVLVENKPGGNAIIGLQSVATSPPDGYTLAFLDPSFASNPSLQKDVPYSLKNFAPVSLAGTAGLIWVVHPDVKAATAKEFIALAKAEPGKLTYGHSGIGSPPHLAPEFLKAKAGIDVLAVPYKGSGPAVQDLLGGRLSMMMTGVSAVKQHVDTGKLRAIAVTGKARSPVMPNVPTLSEAGVPIPELEEGTWWGIAAPAGTPPAVIARLNKAMEQAASNPAIKEKLAAQNILTLHSTPEAFSALIVKETAAYADVIKAAGIKAE